VFSSRWPGKYPLYLPSASSSQNAAAQSDAASDAHLIAFVTALTMLAYNAAFLCASLVPKQPASASINLLHSLARHFNLPDWRNLSHVTVHDPLRDISGSQDFAKLLEVNLKALEASTKQKVVKKSATETEEWEVLEKD
jgi:hypothetical protein